ncbi:MAG: efflux RND transporter periplasmic adaptor subunit, partial [Gammaproteobacteria bacterium]|nr:efflux RND transporter periplasmic adaptor subunit [Gammaproteobacteria bacterium]
TERAGIEGAFIVDENGTVRFRSVRLGIGYKNYQEVLAGPEAGASIVLNPPALLREGDHVTQASPHGS